jgi:predicted nucleic acid-binding protein
MSPLPDSPDLPAAILDTNVFVAAGFNPRSASRQIVRQVRLGQLRMIWNEETRREIRYILEKIPPLSWAQVAELFRPENRFAGPTRPEAFGYIADPEDRKFAALAEATGAVLVTQDDHLLAHRHQEALRIVRPGEFLCGDQT